MHRRREHREVFEILALFRLAVFRFAKLVLEGESFMFCDLAFDDFLGANVQLGEQGEYGEQDPPAR